MRFRYCSIVRSCKSPAECRRDQCHRLEERSEGGVRKRGGCSPASSAPFPTLMAVSPSQRSVKTPPKRFQACGRRLLMTTVAFAVCGKDALRTCARAGGCHSAALLNTVREQRRFGMFDGRAKHLPCPS